MQDLWSTDFQQRDKGHSLQYVGLRKLEDELLSHTMYKNQLKLTKDLSIRPEPLKVLEKNKGNPHAIDPVNNLSVIIPKLKVRKGKVDIWVYTKPKTSALPRERRDNL